MGIKIVSNNVGNQNNPAQNRNHQFCYFLRGRGIRVTPLSDSALRLFLSPRDVQSYLIGGASPLNKVFNALSISRDTHVRAEVLRKILMHFCGEKSSLRSVSSLVLNNLKFKDKIPLDLIFHPNGEIKDLFLPAHEWVMQYLFIWT